MYENITNRLTEKQERFGKFYTEMISSKVDLVEKHFPSHYDYLRDWYESEDCNYFQIDERDIKS